MRPQNAAPELKCKQILIFQPWMNVVLIFRRNRCVRRFDTFATENGPNRQPITQITTGLENRSNPFSPTGLKRKERLADFIYALTRKHRAPPHF